MTVFDVFVNDRKICRAGVGAGGVLSATVTWVRLTGEAHTARRLKEPSEQTELAVGGLGKGIHRRWPGRTLKTGDRVAIIVASARTFDRPTRVEPQDPKLREQQEQRYYLLLKRRFERPRQTLPALRRELNAGDTRFLNVDLDIWSKSPLDALTDAFGTRVCVLHVGREGRRFSAHVELATLPRDPDRLIRRFVALVEDLPRAGRRLWNQAQVREFNLGIQAGTSPYSHELRLEPETLRAMARVDARFGLTVYAAATSALKRVARRADVR